MQIEMNRLKEEAEASKFEMTNRVLQLEISLAEADEERRRLMHVADVAGNESSLDEIDRLKANNASLAAAYQKQVCSES